MLAPEVTASPNFNPSMGGRPEGALGPYVRALKARPWVLLLTVVLAVGAAVALLSVKTDEYEASAQLQVVPLPQGDTTLLGIDLLRDGGDPTRTVQTAATLIQTPRTAAAAATLIPGQTKSSVEEDVKVEPVGETYVIAIVAKNEDPLVAQRLANRYAQAAVAVRAATIRPQIQAAITGLQGATNSEDRTRLARLQAIARRGDPTLTFVSPASRPSDPTGPSDKIVLVLAIMAGLVLGAVAAVLMQRVDRRVREVAELLDEWPLPVLARVPPAHGGRRSVLDPSPGVREAFRTLQIQMDHQHKNGATILLSSASSNDGKSTSAVNLALALAGAGHEVILMDFDLRKPDVANMLGAPSSVGLIGALDGGDTIEDLMQPVPGAPTLKVVTAAAAPGDHALLNSLTHRMPQILQDARSLADFVVIDTAPVGEIGDTLAIVHLADELLMVGRPGSTNRTSLQLARDLLQRSGTAPSGWIIIGDQDLVRSSYYEEEAPSEKRRGVLAGRK